MACTLGQAMDGPTQDITLCRQPVTLRPHSRAAKCYRRQEPLSRTAFVFAGGGSFGAIHVGMLHSLASRGIAADMVVGSSVGALNGAYYAGNPTIERIQRLGAIWRGLRRNDVFPFH
jgi:predicted acylesterase/phospholipase RssA